MRIFVLLAALALPACAGQVLTPGQSIYSAFGGYKAAVESFRDYAVGPTANPAIVSKGRAIVTSKQARAASTFGRAYVACFGSPATLSADPEVRCAEWDFSRPSTVAITLRNTAAAILATTAQGSAK